MRANLRRDRIGPFQALWLVLLLAAGQTVPAADVPATPILGHWLTEPRDGIIAISLAADGSYEGRIVGGNNPRRLDQKNPDPTRRSQRLLGQVILRGMTAAGNGKWAGGTIYDPDSGKTYKCRMELLNPEHLKVRGFVGFTLLGRTQVWSRYSAASLTLPTTSP